MDNSTDTPMRPGMESESIDLLKALRIVRSAGGALCTQISLYGQLARIEWQEEKNRLLKMFMMALLGFACTLCAMLFIGVLVLALSWETNYLIPAITTLIALYGVGISIAWHRFQALSAGNTLSFAATREEIVTDITLIKSRL